MLLALRDRHPSPVRSGSGPGAEQRSSFFAVMFRGGGKMTVIGIYDGYYEIYDGYYGMYGDF